MNETNILIFNFYLNFKVIISMSYNSDSPTPMPAISVCNLNPFDMNNAAAYIGNLLTVNNLTGSSSSSTLSSASFPYNPQYISAFIKANIAGDANLTDSQRQNLGFKLDVIFLIVSTNLI